MHQPPGGPVSSAQSVALEPVGSCEDILTLLSKPLQPHCSNDILMSCCVCLLCVCVCVCVAAQICFNGVGQTAPKATLESIGAGVGAAGPSSPVALHCGWGQQASRAPLPRLFPPAELIPCFSGLTNFAALAHTALSRHWFTRPTCPSHHSPSLTPSLHHPHRHYLSHCLLLTCLSCHADPSHFRIYH